MQAVQSISLHRQEDQRFTLAIASTFTSEPIAESLSFWMEKLAISTTVEFASYNQIFQQLLDSSSLLSTNSQGINIICLRVEDWCQLDQPDPVGGKSCVTTAIERNAQDLVTALQAAVSRSTTPYILCLCPASSMLSSASEQLTLFHQIEAWIVDRLSGLSGLHLIQAQEVQSLYCVAQHYDPQRDRLGHIPFTDEFFAALGTAIARKIYALKHPPHKVIVLDCDNTLWKGVVGEDGVQGISLSASWQFVQKFMVAQQQAGMLLCLCSKNNEADVMRVFEQRQDMALKLDHLVAWRINWQPKSENIKSLAAELNLGLDSFIFMDDNPVECAEVSAYCPEVLTLQLPSEGDVQQFLRHVWAFDHLNVTEEDTQRTALYQQNLERQRFQQQTLTLEDFLSGLEMTVDIAEPASTQISRVAQLTQRTNQFNFTTIRRTEAEIQQFMNSGKASGMVCHAVTVRDRFGDHGLTGVMLFSTDDNTLWVDTFLLSCRVLGRGVEHQMMRHLAKYAEDHGLDYIRLNYIPTPKNYPAFAFLQAITGAYEQAYENGSSFQIPVQEAAAVAYDLNRQTARPDQSSPEIPAKAGKAIVSRPRASKSQQMGQIALEFCSAQEVLAAIQHQKPAQQLSIDQSFIAPRTSTENDLSTIWTDVLNVHPISIRDNYFELGGTSLQAVELFAKIEQFLGRRLALTCLLEAPTIEELARLIDSDSEACSETGNPSSVVLLNTSNSPTPPLFLIHPGGGEVLLYRNLAQRLQPITSVYGIKPFSRNGYPMMQTQIPQMAAYYIEQIRSIQPEGPYLLGGFCAGGAIAFEMALQLQQQGFSVPLVALMNTVNIKEKQTQEQAQPGYSRLRVWRENLKSKLKDLRYKYYLATSEQAPKFIQRKSVYSICSAAVNAYIPTRQFKGKLLLFKSKEVMPNYAYPWSSTATFDPQLGWGELATFGVKVYENEGDFVGMLQEPLVKDMSEQLKVHLTDGV
ncbi:HAD-IIIC family phosphatase [Microcoleus sp. FACHB-1515]|uniref:HAD-IIIC family phosphatase n=1 Tax=Cyanophyceae TaxID=3028117 RepID=UPI00168404E6|nr:HAD-IIIC family phosphatase [Microcoleus sp. FACHB-1515]MBD2088290.1 HAD-IIIC family phosphatase [Microcoleus sp. FACHB-1515]